MSKLVLPDVSLDDLATCPAPLAWVGMQGIDIPIALLDGGARHELHARADVHVDLPAPEVKGIHMSRLHRLLDGLCRDEPISAAAVRGLLLAIIDTHVDCGTRSARLSLSSRLLVRRPALVTDGLHGWNAYPVRLDCSVIDGRFSCRMQVTVGYSSTCPCSAALARQRIAEGFLDVFGKERSVEPANVASWLQRSATLATPHSQRSEARVVVSVDPEATDWGMLALIDRIEQAVGTPVQSAVKRVDEQEFAVLNGQNLMFVEDAARRIRAALAGYEDASVHVRHLESLHPHDAVAWSD